MFGLTKHELDLIHYCGMGLLKLFVFLFFLFPCIAIRMVLRKIISKGLFNHESPTTTSSKQDDNAPQETLP